MRNILTNRYAYSRMSKNIFVSPQIKYCPRPMIEGQHGVLPSRMVPQNIIRPDYIIKILNLASMRETLLFTMERLYRVYLFLIEELKKAAKLTAQTLSHTQKLVQAGMTTNDVDEIVHEFIIKNNAYPTPIGFMGFPKSVCTSVNEVVCHGIPSLRPLENGDYINIDVTLYLNGVHGDSSIMICIGQIDTEIQRLINATQQALYESIKVCKPGTPFNMIGNICEKVAGSNNFVVCELFTGHGVGKLLHVPPMIMHHYNDYKGLMEPGNVFTIEPIILMQHGEYVMWGDNFTVISPDNPSAQWEHTILITETGCEVITKRDDENI